jgi:uncharacterized protein YggU (UPF0235/DUF167 family)
LKYCCFGGSFSNGTRGFGMTERKFEITDARGGTALGVRVVTQAASTEIAGKTDEGTLKIRLVASPAGDPAANDELLSFLASKLGVEKKRLEIVAGANSRDKIISIEGISAGEVEAKLIPAE